MSQSFVTAKPAQMLRKHGDRGQTVANGCEYKSTRNESKPRVHFNCFIKYF
ncbi:hypothetical protein [Fluviispira sanaruensis]|uniref:hypothetical protein n=1 Tax=Fluviispira sanaruensis TaxID=2493639 RepID=UPI00155874BE|nr:hypothetical protein [Fluviispira sanaruensis]